MLNKHNIISPRKLLVRPGLELVPVETGSEVLTATPSIAKFRVLKCHHYQTCFVNKNSNTYELFVLGFITSIAKFCASFFKGDVV